MGVRAFLHTQKVHAGALPTEPPTVGYHNALQVSLVGSGGLWVPQMSLDPLKYHCGSSFTG